MTFSLNTAAPVLRRSLLSLAIAGALPAPLWAAESDPEATLPTVTVTGAGLPQAVQDMGTPATVLSGDALVRQRAATLGESLAGEPGVASSHFGAGASRPIIRGLDGPRVRVLSDGAELHDASTVSPDHAVALEPLLATQIEVLRGPSALVQGNGAVGGVVNVLDGKIPTAIPERGYEGSAELRAGTAAQERAGVVSLTGGAGNLAVHVEGVARESSPYRVGSGWQPEGQRTRRVPGSFNDTGTASLGLSWVGERGYLGAAYTRQSARYGLPGHSHSDAGCHPHGNHLHCPSHDDHGGHQHSHSAGHGHGSSEHDHDHDHPHDHSIPWVDLRSERIDVRGELRRPLPGFDTLRLRGGVTDYGHDEIEDGAVGTRFTNRAHDLRLELQHSPIRLRWPASALAAGGDGGAQLTGLVGAHTGQRRFKAEGDEAYVQPTRTRTAGVFWLQALQWSDWRVEGALRYDRQTAQALTSGLERHHGGGSASVGAVWKFTPGYQLGSSLTQARRAPAAEELYARGLHLATRTYEIGAPDLRSETSQNIDLSLKKTQGATTWAVSAYRNRVRNFIYGRTVDEHEGLQLLRYSQADAVLTGLEAQLRHQLTRQVSLTLFGDTVRASLSNSADGHGALPRIPAARAGLRAEGFWPLGHGIVDGSVEWVHVASQRRTAAFESATPGYGMLHMGLAYSSQSASGTPWQLYLQGRNLTNRLAYAHTSFIKNAAPLKGRDITLGVRVSF